MCQTCSKLIDADEHRFTVKCLQDWKVKAETQAVESIGKPIFGESRRALLEKVFGNAFAVMRTYGTPKTVIDGYDLSIEERAYLWDKVYSQERNGSVYNPYLGQCDVCVQQVPFTELIAKTDRLFLPGFHRQAFGEQEDITIEFEACLECVSASKWEASLRTMQQKRFEEHVIKISAKRRLF